ncbi:hypothetical protein GCM10009679_07700 [Saccharothrix algeriensis]|uniref:Uncharacterized protein n=1 Tax=Catellatospora bangladeshensis TaxID=310355 RepID=A0A8J3JJW0_9ACTN|nr:hypothetical protein Cba03nite_12720 [Catellatospora bangladeshensis]
MTARFLGETVTDGAQAAASDGNTAFGVMNVISMGLASSPTHPRIEQNVNHRSGAALMRALEGVTEGYASRAGARKRFYGSVAKSF